MGFIGNWLSPIGLNVVLANPDMSGPILGMWAKPRGLEWSRQPRSVLVGIPMHRVDESPEWVEVDSRPLVVAMCNLWQPGQSYG